MTPHNSTTKTKSNPAVVGDIVVLLAAPSHDDFTEYTSALVVGLPNLSAPARLCVIDSPITYEQLLLREAIDPGETEVALIFCGHGEDASLRGPGVHPGAANYRTAQSSFYDNSQHRLCPKFMLAFCCNAANGLGKTYEEKTAGQTFVGFDDRIWFVMEGGPYADWWKKILHTVAEAMLNASDVYELEQAAQNVYRAALRAFSSEKDGEHDWGLLMRSYLRRQWRAMNFIQT